jgi:hypothetical protein
MHGKALCYVSRGFSLHAARSPPSRFALWRDLRTSKISPKPWRRRTPRSGLPGKSRRRQVPFQAENLLVGRHLLHHSIRARIAGKIVFDRAPAEGEHHAVSRNPRTACRTESESRPGWNYREYAFGGKEEIRLYQVSLDLGGSTRARFPNRHNCMSCLSGKNENHRLPHRPRVGSTIPARRRTSDRGTPDRAGKTAASNGIRVLISRPHKAIPFEGRWILLSRGPKHPLPENLYSVRECRSRTPSTSLPLKRHGAMKRSRFTVQNIDVMKSSRRLTGTSRRPFIFPTGTATGIRFTNYQEFSCIM